MVLVSAKDKRAIYVYLLQEGVFCFKKDYTNKNENLDIPNINCFLVLRSLKSRKFVTEIFSWQWHYYFLTEEGIKYLRTYLGLPDTIIPKTMTVQGQENNEEKEEERGEDRRGRGTGRGRGRGRGRGGRQNDSEQQENKVEA